MKKNIGLISFAVWMGLVMTGCSQNHAGLAEIATVQGDASSEASIQNDNANRARRAAEMESDLASRHRFYQGVRGRYEGSFQSENNSFRIRVTLIPSLSPMTYTRVRALEEITSDLTQLSFSAQVLQWDEKNPLSAVGCRVDRVSPNITTGEIAIASSNCTNVYLIHIAESIEDHDHTTTAQLLRDGKISAVPFLHGDIQPSTNSRIYTFSAKKVELER